MSHREPYGTPRPHRRRRRRLAFPPWAGLLLTCAAAVLVGGWFGTTRGFFVPTQSMEPTLLQGDRIQADTWFSRGEGPRRGELWVFTNPTPDSETGAYLVKRVVALPGERVEQRDGKLLVNGREQIEPYRREPAAYRIGPVRLNEDEYWVLGDNRNASGDSHTFGPLHRSRLLGRVFLRFWPPERLRVFPRGD